jgi:hypothetical protein
VTVGAYPGTFNPPTVAHLAIAEAARRQGQLDRLDLVVSRVPLGKDPVHPPLEHRLQVLEAIAATRPWLGVRVTDQQLIAEVAAGYDAVVLGSDKWLQIQDPAWYGSLAARDRTLAALPRLLLIARPTHPLSGPLPAGAVLLAIDPGHRPVSSSAVRAGRKEWLAAEAAAAGWWGQPDPDRPNPPGRGD